MAAPARISRRVVTRLIWAAWPLALAGAVLIALVGSRPERLDVPRLAGLDRDVAVRLARQAGLRPRVVAVHSNRTLWEVLRQDPRVGSRVEKGRGLTLFVSSGPPQTTVPAVTGLRPRRARAKLERAGLRVKVVRRRSDSTRRGRVAGVDPPPTARVARGTRVKLTVSTGPSRLRTPPVQGFRLQTAERELSRDGLEVVVVGRPSSLPPGTVADQSPPAGEWLRPGDTVRLFVSVPSTSVPMARAVGRNVVRAAQDLWARGLKVSFAYRRVRRGTRDGTVIAQSPRAGSRLRPGARVRLVVARR